MSTKLIGTGPNQVPTNADLGSMAYQDSNYVNIGGGVASLSSLTVTDYTKFEIGATAKPTVPASLTMDFAKTQSLDNRIEFSRASIATRTNAKGFIETVTNDVPRFDYDPVTLQCKGLLIEESRTNLLKGTTTFDTANGWVYGSVTNVLTDTGAMTPNGTTSAYMATVTGTPSASVNYTSLTVTAGTHCFSVYAKKGTGRYINLRAYAFDTNYEVGFDLETGTCETNGTIVSVGNGWYRCSFNFTTTTDLTGAFYIYLTDVLGAYTTTLGLTCYFLYPQVETGSYATSYIPTTTTTVTRQADVAKITGTNFSSFYNQTEGSFYVEATRPNYSATTNGSYSQSILTTSDNTDSNRILLFSGASSALYIKESGNVVVNTSTTETWNNLTQQKLSAAYKLNDCVIVTGTSTYADTSATIPTVNQLIIGSHFAASAGFFNGCIGKIAYYPKRVTNAELLALVRV